MTTNLAVKETIGEAVERVLVGGDLGKLSADERMAYYKSVCQSIGLNPLTRPLEFITLNGKLTLYARKDATDQLRANNQVSISIVGREVVEGCYVVTAKATMPSGRCDESIGAVPIDQLKGEARSNALMKCETKAKRRVTLSICGMGMLDESEIDSVPGARVDVQAQQSIAKRIADAEAEWQAEGKISKADMEARAKAYAAQTGDMAPRLGGGGSKIIEVSKPLEFSGNDEWIPPAEEPKPDFQPLPPLAELVEKAKKQPLEMKFCEKKAQDWLRIEFGKKLPERYQAGPICEQMRKGWLKSEGYVDADGEGTSTTILERDFKKVAAKMLNWATAQQ